MAQDITESVIAMIRQRSRSGVTTGNDRHPVEREYLRRCTHFHWTTGTLVMFTRDTGHHSSGWFKNSDYEHCRHLSLSFRAPYPGRHADDLGNVHRIGRLMRQMNGWIELAPFNAAVAAEWVRLIHGDDARYAWHEGPFSAAGKEMGVQHWRVFTDPGGNAIKPRGEVYSRELTEAGWQSWSEVQGEHAPKNWVDAE